MRRPGRAKAADPARQAAYAVLRAVSAEDAYANLVLPKELAARGLTGRDAGFATELCNGTLRWTGTLDAVLAHVSSRPLSEIDDAVRDALRLGAYQLLLTRVPAHAAVATTVDLVRRTVGHRVVGFTNAVLRKVAERDLDGWLEALAPDDPVAALALRHAHPEWVVRAFRDALGGDLDEVAAALAADNAAPRVHLAVRPGQADPDQVAHQIGGTRGRWSRYAVYSPGGAVADLPVVRAGQASVQDEGSQLVTLAFQAAALDGPDTRWLDLCAGPGGKAALLGALAVAAKAQVTAVEVAAHRAKLVARATHGLPVTVVHTDGRTVGGHPALPEGSFDRVLVDAPCTGLGALRRRPEARWRRTPDDLATLTTLQGELLDAALRAVRPGGVVGYVTCSPHPAETTAVVSARVQRGREGDRDLPACELLDARRGFPTGMPALGEGPTVQLWPHRHGTDAMFLAVLRRR